MSQPLFAACVVLINNFSPRLRFHEKICTVSFAAVGASLYGTVVRCTERDFPTALDCSLLEPVDSRR